jgi:S-adenosylmethionine:tRNA ribosyltransferase-isomerase
MEKPILMKDYWYDLPPERIALFPLPERDQSKLLVYKGGEVIHSQFNQISKFLPSGSTLFFNDTKVIPARMYFQKESGAMIELFLLHPVSPSILVQQAMMATRSTRWVCTIGNLKRWKSRVVLIKRVEGLTIEADLIDRSQGLVELRWQPDHLSFAEIIEKSGITPLPPYLKRHVESSDRVRYQTVYSQQEGAVAAPTAGLHFTRNILDQLQKDGHKTEFMTLHVSAGTFQPVKVANAAEHTMHQEQVTVSIKNIEALMESKKIMAVGTTTLRMLESLYWYGVRLLKHPHSEFAIEQHVPYQTHSDVSVRESLQAIVSKMQREGRREIHGNTSIYIMPGYTFRVADVLITNFHQPGSTLMLLIAAWVGENWRKIYQEALTNNYRFLSYGDSSLLFR